MEKTNFEGKVCIVRCTNAGVFYGVVKEYDDKKVLLENSRRVWSWEGAASLSQLSVDGTAKPNDCKFPCTEPVKLVNEWIEITPVSEKALETLNSVPVWAYEK